MQVERRDRDATTQVKIVASKLVRYIEWLTLLVCRIFFVKSLKNYFLVELLVIVDYVSVGVTTENGYENDCVAET